MDVIQFTVNDEPVTLTEADVTPHMSLCDFLRDKLDLTGTKTMCEEGGCGLCVVAVTRLNIGTKEMELIAVNSCLVHILSCHQWRITTIEGVSCQAENEYHPLQRRLAMFNGSQCGFCSPGWLMSMYSLLESSQSNLSMEEVERSFGGHMCRCTGYRPILDAFKTFATDASTELVAKVMDIEDLAKPACPLYRSLKPRNEQFEKLLNVIDDKTKRFDLGTKVWYKPISLLEAFQIMTREGAEGYTLVSGNTGRGIFSQQEESKVVVDISSVEELHRCELRESLRLGAGLSLAEAALLLGTLADSAHFAYLAELLRHLLLVAHVPARNIGSLGGNLAMKHAHNDFPSDIFLLLDTVDALVSVVGPNLKKHSLKMHEFLQVDLNYKMIVNVKLPPLQPSDLVKTYKIMPRAQNAHAIVNAGFLFRVDEDNKVINCNIAYGNMGHQFFRAVNTQSILIGKELFCNETLQLALVTLDNELAPTELVAEPSPECRKTIALGLLYKAILALAPNVADRYKSGAKRIKRHISSGVQIFDTEKKFYPLTKPICKIESFKQCAGETKYTGDEAIHPRELFLAFVTSTICVGEIENIDPKEALAIPGVALFYTAKDIPGDNTFTPKDVQGLEFEEEILASKKISYNGQPIGLIAARDQKLAWRAAKLVKVTYTNVLEPVLTVRDALQAPDRDQRIRQDAKQNQTENGAKEDFSFKGSYYVPSQFHYTLERQCARAQLVGDTIMVTAATQWPTLVQTAIAKALNIQENQVEVSVSTVGGGFGGKASRSALVAAAVALVAASTGLPARARLSLRDDMHIVGKRMACDADYEGTVSELGRIQSLTISYYCDCGHSYNDSCARDVLPAITNVYASARWAVAGYSVRTDKASNTWCRAPGTTEGIAIAEHIMEHIAVVINKCPIAVRLKNLDPKHENVPDMTKSFEKETRFAETKADIKTFNENNVWKKRGISFSIMSFPISSTEDLRVTLSVYADGTILIGHGGVEMGQGINTKLAQVCAHVLKVPMEFISIRGYNSFVTPNMTSTSGSVTSESVTLACTKACGILLDRLKKLIEKLHTWPEVIRAAYDHDVPLQVSYRLTKEERLKGYNVYGMCMCEVELDCLTGDFDCYNAHILQDTGVSVSPRIDVGQIEGGFVMGLGLWTSEHLEYDKMTGRLLNDGTWTYKPPGAKDIPRKFTVSFVKHAFVSDDLFTVRSKATGEPAITLSVVVTQALRQAVVAARAEHGYDATQWVHIDTPYSSENILKAIAPNKVNYKLTDPEEDKQKEEIKPAEEVVDKSAENKKARKSMLF